ncbi:LPS export ABC transporter periplasmic protein LptC [Candidatus Pelagibacter sp.]|nr:LPS export ABC transporter periplasmic protein LptC [Candidatus Pelagibacter sp.]
MKRIIQIILFLFIISIIIIFYKVYFVKDIKLQPQLIENQIKLSGQSENNLIKNLKYEINLDENKKYIIRSELSEIAYEQDYEIVKMEKVFAVFIDETNIPLTVTSDKAIYNSSTYNTNFSENVQIEYLDSLIYSDRMDLDINKNIISIYDKVQYEGLYGIVNADNVRIDLITKKIEIYMNKNKDKVEVITKK